ncbi:MAG TPA: DUF3078 domain-containing protein [Bacteroidales bacterium]|nr:DUF3078 domain-containing protein [Bacteroidales bacterium]
MKKIAIFCIVNLISLSLFAQLPKHENDSIPGWKYSGAASLNFSQASLTNWAQGGESSISGLALMAGYADYRSKNSTWENALEINYGLAQRGSEGVRKTDDQLSFSSQYGQRASKEWYYSAAINFNTQMFDGFNYPNDSVKISTFMAPAYLIASLGMEYDPNEDLSLILSPLTGKITFVLDDTLSNQGAFGVSPGDMVRTELGAYFKGNYQKEIIENVVFKTRLTLFSDYKHFLATVDVDWQTSLSMKINDHMSANILANLVYDNDIKFGTGGPRIQFKEVFGLGITYLVD